MAVTENKAPPMFSPSPLTYCSQHLFLSTLKPCEILGFRSRVVWTASWFHFQGSNYQWILFIGHSAL